SGAPVFLAPAAPRSLLHFQLVASVFPFLIFAAVSRFCLGTPFEITHLPDSSSFFQLDVSAKLLPHGAEDFLGKSMVLARAETRVQGGGEHIYGNSFVERSLNGPAAFT